MASGTAHTDARIAAILQRDPARLDALRAVAVLDLPDCWIGAGFIRNAVWDHLHDRPQQPPDSDVDVVWFDAQAPDATRDRAITAQLEASEPSLPWSVKNQARMHLRNADPPYANTAQAITHWPETATAVAVRLREGSIHVLAPHGLDDLFALTLRPTPAFTGPKRATVLARIAEKHWLARWPRLSLADGLAGQG
jgi:hypothetical protein